MTFAVRFLGFVPRTALEVSDSGETSIGKILHLIRESRFGIHDLSRTDLNDAKLPRFNMPFELGLFLGMKAAGGAHKNKMALVFDSEPYRYQQFLSDLAGHDIHAHRANPETALSIIRDWLAQFDLAIPGRQYVLDRYRKFHADLPLLLEGSRKSEPDLLNFPDWLDLIDQWIAANAPS